MTFICLQRTGTQKPCMRANTFVWTNKLGTMASKDKGQHPFGPKQRLTNIFRIKMCADCWTEATDHEGNQRQILSSHQWYKIYGNCNKYYIFQFIFKTVRIKFNFVFTELIIIKRHLFDSTYIHYDIVPSSGIKKSIIL